MEEILGLAEANLISRNSRLQMLKANADILGLVQFYDATIEIYRELLVELWKRKRSLS